MPPVIPHNGVPLQPFSPATRQGAWFVGSADYVEYQNATWPADFFHEETQPTTNVTTGLIVIPRLGAYNSLQLMFFGTVGSTPETDVVGEARLWGITNLDAAPIPHASPEFIGLRFAELQFELGDAPIGAASNIIPDADTLSLVFAHAINVEMDGSLFPGARVITTQSQPSNPTQAASLVIDGIGSPGVIVQLKRPTAGAAAKLNLLYRVF